MNDGHTYTPYHPRWFRRRMSMYWWLERRAYVSFIVRELSSVFVAWFVVYLFLLVLAVSRGEGPYQQFLAWSASPVLIILNAVTLFFVMYHAVTWFKLAPQAMVVHVRGRRVPGFWILGSNYALWLLVSALVAWLLLRA